jgi:hypothetical protein
MGDVMAIYAFVGPNVQVTFDGNPANDRSESSLAIDPLDSKHMVGASKKFTDPQDYAFTLAAYTTFDGGSVWYEAQPLQLLAGWGGISDPVVAFDAHGNAYLVALPFLPGVPPNDVGQVVGIAIYQSTDGINWSPPNVIHQDQADDKQAVAGDRVAASPHFGNVYAAWDSGAGLAFARSVDSGQHWTGFGAQPVGTSLSAQSFAPDIAVAPDSTVHIVWIAGTKIMAVRSQDGGNSFTSPAAIVVGLTPLSAPPLQAPDGFPELPGGTFRVLTLPAACAGSGGTVVTAWADYRDGASRIYYRRSLDGGNTWIGPASGEPLLKGVLAPPPGLHDFHPQLASDPNGDIGCAFYEFGPMPVQNLINVKMAFADDNGQHFAEQVTVTDHPWDPAVDAPRSHGRPTTTFIGDYFGLAASDRGFFPFWTDTRTGIQEIFTDDISVTHLRRIEVPRYFNPLWWIEQFDPEHNPRAQMVAEFAALLAAETVGDSKGRELESEILSDMAATIASMARERGVSAAHNGARRVTKRATHKRIPAETRQN